MKNLKAILLIILGSFFIATGFAFAAETAKKQLKGVDASWNKTASTPDMTVSPFSPKAPVVAKAEEAPKKTTVGEDIKKWVGEHKVQITAGAIGAYVGFALFGGILGALTGGLGLLLILAIAAA